MSNENEPQEALQDAPAAVAAPLPPPFEEAVSQILMLTEELRQSVLHKTTKATTTTTTTANSDSIDVVQWQMELETIVQRLDYLHRLVLDECLPSGDHDASAIQQDLYHHCREKTMALCKFLLESVSKLDVQEQAAIARMVELALVVYHNLGIHANNNDSDTDTDYSNQVIDLYASYQRFVLRERAKPAIAHLAQWRQQDEETRKQQQVVEEEHDDDHDDDHRHTDNDNAHAATSRPHSHAITIILGQASALIHPLIMWKEGLVLPTITSSTSLEHDLLKLCTQSIHILDEQAQSLTKTVSDWFWIDQRVDDQWMKMAAQEMAANTDAAGTAATGGGGGGSGKQRMGSTASNKKQSSNNNDDDDESGPFDLIELDALVEEMAFGSQLLARYQTLLHGTSTPTNLVQQELLPEWTWKYASLERFLAKRQWQSALNMAMPVSIVMGQAIQVPSVVEDAHYLSTRALERAASTLSQQAMGTVAHGISHDIWNTDYISNGSAANMREASSAVYQALVDQRGCWSSLSTNNGAHGSIMNKQGTSFASAPTSNTSSGGGGVSNSFASALLGALDEDLSASSAGAPTSSSMSPPRSKRSSAAPSSGGFLGSLLAGEETEEQQISRLDMELCQLNGIQSASAACLALPTLFEDGDEPDDNPTRTSSSMIQLAREELLRYASAYQVLLTNQIQDVIHEWCGSLQDVEFRDGKCIHSLRHYFLSESYELNADTITAAEADERLERELLHPFRESRLIENLHKCETEVKFLICKELNALVATLLLQYLWRDDKKFTDWGSLLLSKQVRMVQTYLSSLAVEENAAHAAALLDEWQRVSQVVTLLQLEKPSDWSVYYQHVNHVLATEEVKQTLSLRVDFSKDAIAAVCGSAKDTKDGEEGGNTTNGTN